MATEYPKNLYRWSESGEKASKLFNTEADVEAGWVAHEDLGAFGAKPVKAAKPSAPEADDVAAKIADAEKRAAEADAALAALKEEPEDAPQEAAKPRRRKGASD
jgi:hypothetical protein